MYSLADVICTILLVAGAALPWLIIWAYCHLKDKAIDRKCRQEATEYCKAHKDANFDDEYGRKRRWNDYDFDDWKGDHEVMCFISAVWSVVVGIIAAIFLVGAVIMITDWHINEDVYFAERQAERVVIQDMLDSAVDDSVKISIYDKAIEFNTELAETKAKFHKPIYQWWTFSGDYDWDSIPPVVAPRKE